MVDSRGLVNRVPYTRNRNSELPLFYTEHASFYASEPNFMTNISSRLNNLPVLDSRLLRHASFWMLYYVAFSLLWAAPPERSYFASFYLEFVLMPLRILASYCMMYMLIPTFLTHRKVTLFLISYGLLIAVAGGLQMLIGTYFYAQLLLDPAEQFSISMKSWLRNVVLINSTVILLGAAKVIQLYFQLLDAQGDEANASIPSGESDPIIEVKSNRRTHRLRVSDIEYVQGMGNYITYVTKDGQRRVVYSSLKAAQAELPDCFVRIHRSYLVNRLNISAYDKDSVTIGDSVLPRAHAVSDAQLQS